MFSENIINVLLSFNLLKPNKNLIIEKCIINHKIITIKNKNIKNN